MPVAHYENFPVASLLLPAHLRGPVEAIYAFARGADNIADEGHANDAERLAGLDAYGRSLDEIESGEAPREASLAGLASAIAAYHLPLGLFRDLLDAFRQDVLVKRYEDFAGVMDYSRRSANPIGRLLLHLFRCTDDESLRQSDAICSSLQLINFWQDVALDWKKGRVYLPQEDLRRFRIPESQIAEARADERWAELMAFECRRARDMLRAGAPLGRSLPGRIGLEIRATVAGGAAILDKIDAVRGDVFARRPVLRSRDWILIVLRALVRSATSNRGPK